jgi:hypothetical protein
MTPLGIEPAICSFVLFQVKGTETILRRGSAAARMLGLGFESLRGYGCLFLVTFGWFQVEVSGTGRSFVQGIPTECGVSECDKVQQYPSAPKKVGSKRLE